MADLALNPASKPAANPEEVYAKFTVAAAAFFLVLELANFMLAAPLRFATPSIDGFGAAVGRDFLNSWMGGRSAFSGGPSPATRTFPTITGPIRGI
jgi:hypothetical protein